MLIQRLVPSVEVGIQKCRNTVCWQKWAGSSGYRQHGVKFNTANWTQLYSLQNRLGGGGSVTVGLLPLLLLRKEKHRKLYVSVPKTTHCFILPEPTNQFSSFHLTIILHWWKMYTLFVLSWRMCQSILYCIVVPGTLLYFRQSVSY